MNAALLEQIDAELQALPRSGAGNCLALTLIGDESKWLQFVIAGTVNAAYPFNTPPAQTLPAFALAVPLRSWQAGAYAAFELGTTRGAVLTFIDRYFQLVLGCSPDYRLGFEVITL